MVKRLKALIAKRIGRALAMWYWRQVDWAGDKGGPEPKSWGQWFIFEWWWTRPGDWSIGVKYLVRLWKHERVLRVSWSNPIETRRRTLLAKALVAKLDKQAEQSA